MKDKLFQCKCGKAYSTAKQFSDHVHSDCKLGAIPYGNAKQNEFVKGIANWSRRAGLN